MEGLDKNSIKCASVDDNSKPSDLLPVQIPSKSLENLMKEREKLDEERKNMYLNRKYTKKDMKSIIEPDGVSKKEIDNLINDKRSLTEKCEDIKFERSMSNMNIGGPKRTFSEISSSATWQDTVIKNEIKKKRQDEEDFIKNYIKKHKYYYYIQYDCFIPLALASFITPTGSVAYRLRYGNILKYSAAIDCYSEDMLTIDEYHQEYCEEREDEDGTKKWYYLDK
jgi:hypothetical protein